MGKADNRTEQSKIRSKVSEDEIELIDILRAIWKWKYLIISGTLIFVFAAMIISFNMQPVYQISMVLKSGSYKVDVDGKSVYLDSANDFKTLIEGELLIKVIDYSKIRNKKGASSSRGYNMKTDKDTNTLKILHKTTDREEGIDNLNYLSNLLIKRYEERLNFLKDNYDHKIMMANKQLKLSIDEEKFITSKINDIQDRLDKYIREIEASKVLSDSRNKPQDTLLDYSSIVEKVADIKSKHSAVSLQIDELKKEIELLEDEKDRLKAIKIIQPPTANPHPVAPPKKRYLMLSVLVGLFLMLFLTFFIEYILKHKQRKRT